jgi:hypothetical protein
MLQPVDPICVDKLIKNFQNFFCNIEASFWELVYAVCWDGEEIDLCRDYQQMSWELLVEGPLQKEYPGIAIAPMPLYGDDNEEKILKKNSNELTHGIFMFPKCKRVVFKDAYKRELAKDKFYSFSGFTAKTKETGGPGNGPVFAYCFPYDFLDVKEFGGKNYYTVKLDDVEFWLMPLPQGKKETKA